MGINTPAIILNDCIGFLQREPDAGKFIAQAIRDRRTSPAERIGVKVLSGAHSSGVQIVAVGGNTIRQIGWSGDCHDTDEDLLRKLADQLGYRIVKKGAKG